MYGRGVRRAMEQSDLWDGFYRANGRAWRGNSRIPDPLSGEGDALDLGCGSGKTTSTLIDLGYRVTGADFSAEAVAICRERFGASAGFEVADVLSLPFGDGSFDYVVAVHVLEHVSDGDMPRAASEIARVMRPGAYLFVRSFTPSDMRSASRSGDGIRYVHRLPEQIAGFFGGLEAVSVGQVDERTRFGTTRSRAECLFRKPERGPGDASQGVDAPSAMFYNPDDGDVGARTAAPPSAAPIREGFRWQTTR